MSNLRPIIRKVDDNQKEIVKAFRDLGYSVRSTAIIGKGFPDIICGKYGHNWLFEIKDGKKRPSERKLSEDEETFWRDWLGSVHLILSVDDVTAFDRKRSHRSAFQELMV